MPYRDASQAKAVGPLASNATGTYSNVITSRNYSIDLFQYASQLPK